MAASASAIIQKENENFFRVCSVVLDLCPKLLREGLEFLHPARGCPPSIAVPKNAPKLSAEQTRIIINISNVGSYDECDITLLCRLYRALVKSFKPTKGWGKPVPSTAALLADDLERIRILRNERIGHCQDNRMTDADYANFLTDMNNMMVRADINYGGAVVLQSAGTFVAELDRLKTCCLDTNLQKVKADIVRVQADIAATNAHISTVEQTSTALEVRATKIEKNVIAVENSAAALELRATNVENTIAVVEKSTDEIGERTDITAKKVTDLEQVQVQHKNEFVEVKKRLDEQNGTQLEMMDRLEDLDKKLTIVSNETSGSDGDPTTTTHTEKYWCWMFEPFTYCAYITNEETEEIISEDLIKQSEGTSIWEKNHEVPFVINFHPSNEDTLRVVGVNMKYVHQQTCRVDVNIRNKSTRVERILHMILQTSQASHQSTYGPFGADSKSTITVKCHIKDEKDEELIFKGCGTKKADQEMSANNLITLGGGKQQVIDDKFDWTALCLRNGFFVGEDSLKEDYDKMVLHLSDWEKATKEQWKKCFSLESQLIIDKKGSKTSKVIDVLEKKFEGNGLFVFEGYDTTRHLSFLSMSQREEIVSRPDIASIKTTLLFAPGQNTVLLIREMILSANNNIKLEEIDHALSSLPGQIGQFLSLHSKHFTDSQLFITAWLLVPIEKTSFRFPPCCSICKEQVFFKEDLASEATIVERWDALQQEVLNCGIVSDKCRERYKEFLANIIGFLSTTDVYLPDPFDSTSLCIKKIFLTKTQRKVLSIDAMHAYITGGYGSGKSVILQIKLAHMMEHFDSKHKIIYASFNRKSLVVQSMDQLSEALKGDGDDQNSPDIIVGHHEQLAEKFGMQDSGLMAFIQTIQRYNSNASDEAVYHLIADEYDPSTLTMENAQAIRYILRQPALRRSTVWIAIVPMQKRRTKITKDGEEVLLTRGYYISETEMEHLQLGCVFRFTEEIYQLLKVGIDVMTKSLSEFHYRENEDNKEAPQEPEIGPKSRKKKMFKLNMFKRLRMTQDEKNSNKNAKKADDEKKDIVGASPDRYNDAPRRNSVSETTDKVIQQTKSGLDNLDHLFKANQNAEGNSDTLIETLVNFWENEPSEYNVSGQTPLLINLFDQDINMECTEKDIIFRMYAVLIKIVKIQEKGSIAIMATNISEVNICEQALELLSKRVGLRYAVYLPTLRPREHGDYDLQLGGIDAILSDTDGLTGLEYDKVIIPLTLSEQFLSSTLARTLSRAQNLLFFVVLPTNISSVNQNSITMEIVNEWKKNDLVQESIIKMRDKCLCSRDDKKIEMYFCKEECNEDGVTLWYACPRSFGAVAVYLDNLGTKPETNMYKKQYTVGERYLASMLSSGRLFQAEQDNWEIPSNTLKLSKKLGGSPHSEVWAGVWNTSPVKLQVAVKRLHDGMTSVDYDVLAEASPLLKSLTHEHIIQIYGILSNGPDGYVMEFLTHGSLHEYLSKGVGKNLPDSTLIGMMAQIADGMAYLETLQYVHRNLMARSILVGDHHLCKIADFDLARKTVDIYAEYTPNVGHKFPIKWLAPEAVLYDHWSTKSDVWSFGIVMMEIITKGRVPYPGMTNAETIAQVERGYRMPAPPGCKEYLYKIMEQCWHKEPTRRLTFEYLKFELEDYAEIFEDFCEEIYEDI